MEKLIESILFQKDLMSEEIPALDLYMDQIMTLFDDKLQSDKRYDDDKLLTKTMINNYSKVGLINSVKGKKYTKEQILQMLLVYNLKNTISIQEIKKLITPLYEQDIAIQEVYDQFISIKHEQSEHTKDMIQQLLQQSKLNLDTDVDRFLIVLCLSSVSQQLTKIVQKILDTYYE